MKRVTNKKGDVFLALFASKNIEPGTELRYCEYLTNLTKFLLNFLIILFYFSKKIIPYFFKNPVQFPK